MLDESAMRGTDPWGPNRTLVARQCISPADIADAQGPTTTGTLRGEPAGQRNYGEKAQRPHGNKAGQQDDITKHCIKASSCGKGTPLITVPPEKHANKIEHQKKG